MNLSMTLEVMAADEAFLAVVASELPITEVSLDMRLDVLLTTESLVAIFILADPFVVIGHWTVDELRDIVEADICFFDGC